MTFKTFVKEHQPLPEKNRTPMEELWKSVGEFSELFETHWVIYKTLFGSIWLLCNFYDFLRKSAFFAAI